ncbi:MAG TPA: hypothetical protein VF903_09000 [Nitrospirota bacterium]
MRRKQGLAVVLTIVLGMVAWSGYAAEELFDAEAAKHTEQGINYLKAKNYDAAIEEFEASSSIYPDAEAYYYLGYTYYMKGRGGDAESRKKSMEYFEKTYELDPNFSPTKYKPTEPVPPAAERPQQAQAPVTSRPSPTAPAAETAAPQDVPKP